MAGGGDQVLCLLGTPPQVASTLRCCGLLPLAQQLPQQLGFGPGDQQTGTLGCFDISSQYDALEAFRGKGLDGSKRDLMAWPSDASTLAPPDECLNPEKQRQQEHLATVPAAVAVNGHALQYAADNIIDKEVVLAAKLSCYADSDRDEKTKKKKEKRKNDVPEHDAPLRCWTPAQLGSQRGEAGCTTSHSPSGDDARNPSPFADAFADLKLKVLTLADTLAMVEAKQGEHATSLDDHFEKLSKLQTELNSTDTLANTAATALEMMTSEKELLAEELAKTKQQQQQQQDDLRKANERITAAQLVLDELQAGPDVTHTSVAQLHDSVDKISSTCANNQGQLSEIRRKNEFLGQTQIWLTEKFKQLDERLDGLSRHHPSSHG